MRSGQRRLKPKAPGGYQPDWVRFVPEAGATYADGSGLVKYLPFTGQPATIDSVFAAVRVRSVNNKRRNRLMWADNVTQSNTALFNLASSDVVGSEGKVIVTAHDSTVFPFPTEPDAFAASFANIDDGSEYILAFSCCGSTGAMTAVRWKWGFWNRAFEGGGVVNHPVTYPSSSAMTILDTEAFMLFGGNYKFQGQAAWAWFHVASDASAYVDLSDQAGKARDFLLDDPETWTLPTPLLHFQGPASEWNAGTNRGSGGNFLITVPVTDS